MIENNAEHTTPTIYIVDECRGCGRAFAVPGYVAASAGNSEAIVRCGECDTTNRTDQTRPWPGESQ